jgi:hypothetical protein
VTSFLLAGLALPLAGCMTMDGPCQIDLQVSDGGSPRPLVQCEAGGAITIVAPANSIEAAGQAARPACTCRSEKP